MGRSTDYSNCYIYHIVDSDKVVHYVGSTSNFNSRKSKHKYCCNTENNHAYNVDIYKFIRANGDWDAFEMIPIRKIENISNKTELRIEEQSEINKFSTLKNKMGSYRTLEQKIECDRLWKENNPEKNYESHRKACIKYREANSEKISEYACQYREANREAINEKQRQYYQKQKELKSDQ